MKVREQKGAYILCNACKVVNSIANCTGHDVMHSISTVQSINKYSPSTQLYTITQLLCYIEISADRTNCICFREFYKSI
jgi:hypothetical protein